jgi:putative ABC transport system permease protein
VVAIVASPGYFKTTGVQLIRGRAFNEMDGLPDKQAVIVNQRFMAKYWPGEDPLGKRIKVSWDGDKPWLTVVGVSQDFRQTNPQQVEIDPMIYIPYRAKPLASYSILTRASVSPTSLTSAMRREVQSLDADLPVFSVQTLLDSFEQQRWPFKVFGSLFAIFALIALLLSAVGLYAVMSYSVTQRRQEIGLRIAMGASSRNVLMLVLWQGVRQLAIGLVIGLAAAFGLARVLKSLLVQITPTDPLTFTAISLVLVSVGILACWIPARWAMRVDPLEALRYE